MAFNGPGHVSGGECYKVLDKFLLRFFRNAFKRDEVTTSGQRSFQQVQYSDVFLAEGKFLLKLCWNRLKSRFYEWNGWNSEAVGSCWVQAWGILRHLISGFKPNLKALRGICFATQERLHDCGDTQLSDALSKGRLWKHVMYIRDVFSTIPNCFEYTFLTIGKHKKALETTQCSSTTSFSGLGRSAMRASFSLCRTRASFSYVFLDFSHNRLNLSLRLNHVLRI